MEIDLICLFLSYFFFPGDQIYKSTCVNWSLSFKNEWMNELFSLFFHFFLHFSTNCVHVDKTTTNNNNNNNHHFYFVFPLIWWVMYPHLIFIYCGRVVCFNSYWSLLLVCVCVHFISFFDDYCLLLCDS